MATAIAVGSLLSSGTAAVAGSSLFTGATAAAVASTATTAATAFSVASGVASIFAGQDAGDASAAAQLSAARAQTDAARTQYAESQLSAQRERTQAAIEEAERQRRLRRTLASQRAAFAGGAADINSGSILAIQDDAANEINRESNLAAFASDQQVSAINRQGQAQLSSGLSESVSLISSASATKAKTASDTLSQVGTVASQLSSIAKTSF